MVCWSCGLEQCHTGGHDLLKSLEEVQNVCWGAVGKKAYGNHWDNVLRGGTPLFICWTHIFVAPAGCSLLDLWYRVLDLSS